MAYKHGVTGELGASAVKAVGSASALPLYVGTAPIGQIPGYATKGLVNTPLKLTDLTQAQALLGYSDDWKKFTLCEAIDAHFANTKGNIGPIYVINVLDPSVHQGTEKTLDLTFTDGKSTIENADAVILDTIALDGKVKGEDFDVSYDIGSKKVTVYSLGAALTGTIEASYKEAVTTSITSSTIIGTADADAGSYTGLQAGRLIYPRTGDIINMLAAPGWSEIPAVYAAMTAFVQSLNGHWNGFVFADIPVKDGANLVDTISKAKTWKNTNAFNSMFSGVCWPQWKSGGKIYHLSTVALVEQIRVDNSHDGIPMETMSNELLGSGSPYFGADSTNQGYDETKANELNAAGIITVSPRGGQWYLWGPHTAGFAANSAGTAADGVDPLAIFISNIRMQCYITNQFQIDHGPEVDQVMNRGLQQRILFEEQNKLDALAAVGALIGSPKVSFIESQNSTTSMVNGNFVWTTEDTPSTPAKSLHNIVSYTDEGFESFFEE